MALNNRRARKHVFGFASASCPVKISDISINALWHARNHREPCNRWLRQITFDEFAHIIRAIGLRFEYGTGDVRCDHKRYDKSDEAPST